MECIPAIDLRNGRSVRLLRGDYDAETIYGDPLEQASAYADGGATRLHVVDLDAARTGVGVNDQVIAKIAGRLDIPIEVGGGVRSLVRAAQLFDAGVDTVVVGTAAIEDPSILKSLAAAYPGKVAVGLDHRRAVTNGITRREVAVRGWEVGSGVELVDALAQLESLDLAGVIVTDIGRDGTLEGPDLEGLALTLESTSHHVIASGGIGKVDDLVALNGLCRDAKEISGVIIGKALLSGAITLQEALDACAA
jgi:phosphoribosylformimino-5-aminoimidazole carboxamide ribotide isomerase